MRKSGLILSTATGLLLAQLAFAQTYPAPFKDRPGSIPMQPERPAAADLSYQGRELLPDEARDLAAKKLLKNSKGQPIGLDELDPDTTSSVWKKYAAKLHWRGQDAAAMAPINDLEQLNLQENGETLEFDGFIPSPSERYYFTAHKFLPGGKLKIYQIFLDPKGHNMLLRKALLRKIGYIVPPTDRLATVRIKFKNSLHRKNVALEIGAKTFRKNYPWFINANIENEDDYLDLQDVIVTEGPNDRIYNFARGDMEAAVPQGRRLFNALLVPFHLTDSLESLNLLEPEAAKVINNQLILSHPDSVAFGNISYEDARWIMRKILKLDRSQWQDIFAQVKAPAEVSALWMEKVIANRNFILEKLNFQNEFKPLPFDVSISMGERLQKGRLIVAKKSDDATSRDEIRTWPGYARNWIGILPKSPQSRDEMMKIAKVVGFGAGLKAAVAKLNTYIPKTDLVWKQISHKMDLDVTHFLESASQHKDVPIPRKWWTTKFYDIDFAPSRNLVTGAYMGTDNRIQIVDSLHLGVEGGFFFSKDGLAPSLSVTGNVKGWWMLTYDHLKPTRNVDDYFKLPYRNIIVPYYQSQSQHPLEEITKLQPPADKQLTDEEQVELSDKLKAQMAKFDEQLGENEAVIVTRSFGPEFNIKAAKGVSNTVEVFLRFKERFTIIDRVQIYRKDKNTIQVSFDPGAYNTAGPALGIGSNKLPFLNLNFDWEWKKKGVITTSVFEFNINPDLQENPNFFQNIWAVTAALRGTSIEYFQDMQKEHWKIEHHFKDPSFSAAIPFGRLKVASTTDQIRINDKNGNAIDFVRRVQGYRTGIDFQTLAFGVATYLLQKKSALLGINPPNNGNPGDTIKGSSFARIVRLEVEGTAKTQTNPSGVRWDNIFGNVQHAWKGWNAKRDKAEKIMQEINGMYGQEVFAKNSLYDTKEIQFYTIDVRLSFYQKALYHIAQLTDDQVDEFFKSYYRGPSVIHQEGTFQENNTWATAIKIDLKTLRRAIQEGNKKKIAESFADIIDVAENQLEFTAVKKMVGGMQNLKIDGSLRSFRDGHEETDPGVDADLPTNTGGQIGSYEPEGPLAAQLSKMRISPGQGLILWLLNTLM